MRKTKTFLIWRIFLPFTVIVRSDMSVYGNGSSDFSGSTSLCDDIKQRSLRKKKNKKIKNKNKNFKEFSKMYRKCYQKVKYF